MDERLKARLEELRKQGLCVDLDRGVASLRVFKPIRFAAKKETDIEAALSMDEDEEYLYAPFRALSATLIRDRGLDFSNAAVLKKSVRMMQGQTVYANHNTDVTAWHGTVVKAWWDDSTDIPPGINVTLRINKQWSPRVVAGIKEGAIHSASVEVYFEYKKSHPDLADFWYHFGEEIDGKPVCLIVTNIVSYGEISLVWQGADVYAKRLSANQGGGDGVSGPGKTNKESGGSSMKLTRQWLALLGLMPSHFGFSATAEAVELDEALQSRFIDEVKNRYEELAKKLEAQSAILTATFAGKEASVDLGRELAARAAMGDAYLTEVRSEAVKFAKLSEGSETLTEALEKTIQNASLEDAKKFRDEYRAKSEKLFPAKCPQCGTSMTRGSAARTPKESDEGAVDAADYAM